MPDTNVSSTPSVNPSTQAAPATPAIVIEPLAPAAPAFADSLMGVDLPSAEEILAASASQVVANLPPVVATNRGLKAPAANLTDVATKADIAELKDILSRYGIA